MMPNVWLCAVDEIAWMSELYCKEAHVWTPTFVLASTLGTRIIV